MTAAVTTLDSRPERVAEPSSVRFALVAACVILLSFASEEAAIVVTMLVSFWLLWRARPDGILGLLVLFQSRWAFYHVTDFKTMEAATAVQRPEVQVLLAGLPVDALVYVFLAARVIAERFLSPDTFRSPGARRLLDIWLVTLIPAAGLAVYSFQAMHTSGWSIGLRFYLTSSAVFYGMIVARRMGRFSLRTLLQHLVPYVSAILVLMNLHVYWSHQAFLLLGVAVAVAFFLIRDVKGGGVAGGLVLLALVFRVMTEATLTIVLIAVVAAGLLLVRLPARRRKRLQGWRRGAVYGMVIMPLVFPFAVVYTTRALGLEDAAVFAAGTISAESFVNRIAFKTFGDRYPLWSAATNQIQQGPKIIVPADRPLEPGGFYTGLLWTVGAHNTILEVLRNTGLLVGSIILLIYVVTLFVNLEVAFTSGFTPLRCLAAAVGGVAFSGMLTGDFPANIYVGLFIWMFAGIVWQFTLGDSSARDQFRPDRTSLAS